MDRDKGLSGVLQQYETAYRKRNPQSFRYLEAARESMPGGDTRTSIWFSPYPIWIDAAEGCRIRDVDGHGYIDFHNCYSTMILGHADPKVVAAVREQSARGTALGALIPAVVEWAAHICDMVTSVEKIRFTNSGTEAVMMAIRLARGYSGKDMILKTEGGYHGSYDPVVYPSDAAGLPKSVRKDSITVPFNDEKAAEAAIVSNRNRLAAVIVEGAMGAAGTIPPKDGYLQRLRKITEENGVLLILDEVISLRLAMGGVQQIYGIRPDLTTMGKIIGGGYPVGAVGGKEELMRLFSPEVHRVHHSGTLNANPITATAGLATLRQLNDAVIERLNRLGESFADGMRSLFAALGIKGRVTGYGSLQNIHFSSRPVIDGKSAQSVNTDLRHLFHLGMMERGFFSASRGFYVMSTPMTQKEIDGALAAAEDLLKELKPVIEDVWPELIGRIE